MKYYLVVGEASGDLHASNLMKELQAQDTQAQFRFFGGDLMQAVGGTCVLHYRHMAYMGFVPVLLHLRSIFSNLQRCKDDILLWKPDVVILVDYPGFNLKIAEFAHTQGLAVYYYISPKIWAWKEYRIRSIRRYVDELFSILPFEVEFFQKHRYPIHYVGNPCVDAVHDFLTKHPAQPQEFRRKHGLDDRPIIALLAGSRKQEIKDNLPLMLQAVASYPHYQAVVAGAPSISSDYYARYLNGRQVPVLFGHTYEILQHAEVALVTSGTATLETALFGVPQVVCYWTPLGRLISWLRKRLIRVPFISLVNLIAGREVVQELVAHRMTVDQIKQCVETLLPGQQGRETMIQDYQQMARILGPAGASQKAAEQIIQCLQKH